MQPRQEARGHGHQGFLSDRCVDEVEAFDEGDRDLRPVVWVTSPRLLRYLLVDLRQGPKAEFLGVMHMRAGDSESSRVPGVRKGGHQRQSHGRTQMNPDEPR